MSQAAFIDANVPLYAAGRAHRLKSPCVEILGLVADHPEALLTDAEVLQEILHRYLAPERWAAGQAVLAAFAALMAGRTVPVTAEDVVAAGRLAVQAPGVGSRNLVHASVMNRVGCKRVVSADRDFDRIPGLIRLDPALAGDWAGTLGPARR
jgi:predicted nucleic acid-binding protein